MNKFRKNDDVIVIAGKDKGRRGTLTALFLNKNTAIVEGINLIKKHIKPNPNKQIEGGIVTKEAPIHISNIAIYNSLLDKADRIGFNILEKNNVIKKVRYFKSNKQHLDVL